MPDDDVTADSNTETSSAAAGEGAPQQPLQPHGDPLLASAQGRNDGDDGSRHGWAATAGTGTEGDPASDETQAGGPET